MVCVQLFICFPVVWIGLHTVFDTLIRDKFEACLWLDNNSDEVLHVLDSFCGVGGIGDSMSVGRIHRRIFVITAQQPSHFCICAIGPSSPLRCVLKFGQPHVGGQIKAGYAPLLLEMSSQWSLPIILKKCLFPCKAHCSHFCPSIECEQAA